MASPSTTPSPPGIQAMDPSAITGAAGTTEPGVRPACATSGRASWVSRSQLAVLLASQTPLKSGCPAMRPAAGAVTGAAEARGTLCEKSHETPAVTAAAESAMARPLVGICMGKKTSFRKPYVIEAGGDMSNASDHSVSGEKRRHARLLRGFIGDAQIDAFDDLIQLARSAEKLTDSRREPRFELIARRFIAELLADSRKVRSVIEATAGR